MSADEESSSENTNSESEAIAVGMMNLAIVCAHVWSASTEPFRPTGKLHFLVSLLLWLSAGLKNLGRTVGGIRH